MPDLIFLRQETALLHKFLEEQLPKALKALSMLQTLLLFELRE